MMLTDDLMPKEMFFTKGVGRHVHRLQCFELALRDAGIEKQNLVRVSSIYPDQLQDHPRQGRHRQAPARRHHLRRAGRGLHR